MRLVEDHRVARGQELGQPFVAQHHVGEEQVMVDDDDVGVERLLPRLQHEAVVVKRAVAAEAIVARRRDERPDRRVFRHVGELAAVAARARARERDDLRQVARIVARWQAGRRSPRARDGGGRRSWRAPSSSASVAGIAQRIAHHRQVALEELVLQRLGARGDDHLAAVEQRRNEVREGLAGAGAGLGDQRLALRNRAGDGVGHRQLLRAKTEAAQRPGERAAGREDRREIGIRRWRDDSVRRRGRQAQFAPLDAGAAAVLGLTVFAGAAGLGLVVLASAVRTALACSRNSPYGCAVFVGSRDVNAATTSCPVTERRAPIRLPQWTVRPSWSAPLSRSSARSPRMSAGARPSWWWS